MLIHLGVRDFAIVDNLALDLGPGMTVLTGETGAGKSLIVDALELAVGERARSELVRSGAESAEVDAVFEPATPVLQWLRDNALEDEDGMCVLRRVVSADGRSRAFINARPVPVAQLRALGEQLVDVHGQHAHQALLKPEAQRLLLDAYAEPSPALEQVSRLHGQLRQVADELDALGEGGEAPAARLDYLAFQIAELSAHPLSPAALDELEREHRRLAHAAEILAAVAQASGALDEEQGGAETAVATALRRIDQAARLDPALGEARELLRQCATLLAESGSSLRRYSESMSADDARLQELERQLTAVHDLARKHRCPPAQLHQRLQSLEQEHERLRGAAQRIEALTRERTQLLQRYREAARSLHRQRLQAGERMAAAAGKVLDSLGMSGAGIRFQVRHDDEGAPAAHGTDAVALQASTNPGQPYLPLARVASGGELSRIALALHTVAVNEGGALTLVFDEVDAGVGGAVAGIVGRRMRELGEQRQVLTVTHLPQVAAVAHHHVAVLKRRDERGSHSEVAVLRDQDRVAELARMLAGEHVTEATLAHAREMMGAGAGPRRPRGRRPAA